MNVEKILVSPTYMRENGLWALNTQNLLPEETFTPTDQVEQAVIWLPQQQIAGNHKHERKEVLFGIGATAYFLWQDIEGRVHEEAMNPGGKIYLFIIPPTYHTQSSTNLPTCQSFYTNTSMSSKAK